MYLERIPVVSCMSGILLAASAQLTRGRGDLEPAVVVIGAARICHTGADSLTFPVTVHCSGYQAQTSMAIKHGTSSVSRVAAG
jgi:hypothetical protein